MGKKKKKSLYKKTAKFVSNNNVWLAALGGAATGAILANVLGSERAKVLLDSVSSSVNEITAKITGSAPEAADKKRNKSLQPV